MAIETNASTDSSQRRTITLGTKLIPTRTAHDRPKCQQSGRRPARYSRNPPGNGSLGSRQSVPCPVIQARPGIAGAIAGVPATSVSAAMRPVKSVPMMDSWPNAPPTPSSPRAWRLARRAEVPVPHGERSSPAGATTTALRYRALGQRGGLPTEPRARDHHRVAIPRVRPARRLVELHVEQAVRLRHAGMHERHARLDRRANPLPDLHQPAPL